MLQRSRAALRFQLSAFRRRHITGLEHTSCVLTMGHGRPHHIVHIRLHGLRYSGYDFSKLYTVGGYSHRPHIGVLARVPTPTLQTIIVVGLVQRRNCTSVFD